MLVLGVAFQAVMVVWNVIHTKAGASPKAISPDSCGQPLRQIPSSPGYTEVHSTAENQRESTRQSTYVSAYFACSWKIF